VRAMPCYALIKPRGLTIMNISKNPSASCGIELNTEQTFVGKSQVRSCVNVDKVLTARSLTESSSVKPSTGLRSAKLALFVEEYLNANFNGTKAAIAVGYSRASARVKASELLSLPKVHTAIEISMRARAERLSIDTDAVLTRMCSIAFADPRELIEIHRYCCRYCYGKNHRYQWTPSEFRDAQEICANSEDIRGAGFAPRSKLHDTDWKGGLGFNRCADPNPECPECFGDGIPHVVVKDTRDLSPAARTLFAGAKKTPWGVDIKMNDQSAMLTNLARHLGMFTPCVTDSPSVVFVTPGNTA
jgi:phage terminase small subunit